MAAAAAAGGGGMPTEEEGRAPQHFAGDRLLLASCRAIKKQTGWQHRTLRTACDWATGELEINQHPGLGLSRYYRVVELGMECNSEEVVEEALGQLHKLIAGGLVRRNTMTTLKDGSSANLAEILVDVVLLAGAKDKTVRRGGRAQAVKCLLSCVTSPEIQVRGVQLRRVYLFVRETFLVIDSTANRARHNKAQARATLDHILQVVFSRLEMEDSPLPSLDGHPTPVEAEGLALSSVDRRPILQTRAIEALLSPQPTAPEATPTSLTSPSLSSKATAEDARTMESLYEASTGFHGEAGEAAPSSASGVESEGVPTEVEVAEAVEGEDEEGFVSSNQDLDDVALGGEDVGDGEGKVVEERKDEDEGRQETGDRDGDDGAGTKFTVAQSDALMLLSDLCNWSLANERSSSADGGVTLGGGEGVESEAKLLESKTAALELIVAVLRNYGGARFRALPAAASLVKEELCPALLHHCTSDVTEMVSLSLRVFVALVKGFKNHLKAEVEVFITSIFLRILESEHSAFDHKMLVLEAISGLCRDPVALVEMFVNYDCDLKAIDLFKRIVTALTKVAKGRSIAGSESAGKKELEEERSLQLMGMAGTVDVVASMVKAADLEELEGEMAMAPSRENKNSAASERAVSLSLSPGRASSCTTPTAATNSSLNRLSPRTPRANSEVGTSTNYRPSTAASILPTDDGSIETTLPGTSTTIPDYQSGEGAVEARPRASALSSTWKGGQVQNSVSVAAAADGLKRSRRGFSVGVWGTGEGATKRGDRGRPESTSGRRGSFRFDGQPQGEAMLQAFDTKRRVQREIEVGIVKFNQKPKEGLAYLNSKGHLDSGDPISVASFLREQAQRLDKTEVGEFLGRGADYMGGFCVKVLHAYVDGMDFTDMLFDEAIRHFLSGFRLPGEAQKIDRMMEKFAERFCLQNGSVFPNPDTAFILAFSIVMLNTDLHNPSIPDAKRMTKEGFIKNNSGIDQGKSLPDDFLGGLYDRIASTPISLKEDDQLRRAAEGVSSGSSSLQEFLPFSRVSSATSKRRAAHSREREDMLKSSRRLLTRQRGPSSTTNRYTHLSVAGEDDVLVSPDIVDHVRLMYEISWGPVLAVFSEVLESSDDSELIDQCLEGFTKAVRIAGGLDMTTARETLVNALVRFTLLESSRHMKDKNVRCVKVLLCLALTDGNLLRESWGLVLRCISQLSRLQLFASSLQQNEFAAGANSVAETPPRKITETTSVRKNAGSSIGVSSNNGSNKTPRTPQAPEGPAVEDSETSAGKAGGTKAAKGVDAVAGTADEAGSREKLKDIDEKKHPTEESMTANTTTTMTVSSSADWLSDLKLVFGVTGGGSTPKSSSGGSDGGGGAMEQVMSYVKERDALLNDRRRKEREKAMGELATFFMGPSREEKAKMVEEGNATAVMGQIDQELIDRVFSATRLLNREAMQHFVEQLIHVSRSEIPQLSGRRSNALGSYQRQEGVSRGGGSGGTGLGGGSGGGVSVVSGGKPRVFSMQKLVEIAHLNMDVRSRIEWARLWGALADHLGTVGSMSGSTSVAMYTVDCLRQLALKFLDKDELRDFNFQRIFLGPFATIFRDSREAEIRELVVSCLNNIVLTKGPLIRSGWKTVLSVLRAAARDPKEDVVQPASRMLARLSGEQFPLVQYDFVDLVHALLEMSTSSKFLDVSLECVGHIRSCARELGEGRVDVTLQRPLLEATVSNTGQLPREVMEAAMADLGRGREREAEFGGDRGKNNLRRLKLDLDSNDDDHLDGDGDSLSPLSVSRVKQKQSLASSPSKESDSPVPVSGIGSAVRARLALRLWWPLLAGLAEGVGDPRLDCRAAALSTLQDVLREYGSAPEFSVRVWPFILTRILLPASRHAGKTFPPSSSSPLLRPSLTTSLSVPQSRTRLANAVPSASPRNIGVGAGAGAVSRSHHSHSSSAAAISSKALLSPASRGALPLDVGSWVHTTAPQLFRAAVIVVTRNAKAAVPLGLPALMAFLDPHVCCSYRRRNGRGGSSRRRRGLSWPPDDGNREEEEEEEEAGREHALMKKKKRSRRESQPERREVAAAAVEARWSEEMEAAAAAGALAAEEAGGTGSCLMSRIALESLGLLLEGLIDHEVPQEVLSFACDSLLRMLRRCLPNSIGDAGMSVVYGTDPAHAVPLPRTKSDGEKRGADSGAGCHFVGQDAYAARPQVDTVGGLEMDSLDEADGNGVGVSGGDVERGTGLGRGNADDAWAFSRGKEPGRAQGEVAGGDEDGGGIDGKRAGALLSGALRLERVLYGLARLHLLALGEDRARVLLGGLSEGVRYARAFHDHLSLRMSLFSAGIIVPRSGAGAGELPHLLEQESEGLCYIFAVSFRLLGVRWPLPSTVTTNASGGNMGTSDHGGVFDSGQSSATIDSTSSSLWPNHRAFEPSLPSSLRQQHQHQQQGSRLRPPRRGQDSGGRDLRISLRVASRGVPPAPATPMLVVDDLLDWSGEGNAGPAGSGGDAVARDAGSNRVPLWDGTVLAREFLCNEGSALLKRYFEVDGGVQRGRLEDGTWNSDDEGPLSPLSARSFASPRPPSEAAPSSHGGSFGPESSAPVNPPPGTEGGKSRQEKSAGNVAPPQAPRVHHGAIRPDGVDLVASREAEVRHLTPAVLLLLRGLLLIDSSEEFARHVSWVYHCLVDLVVVRSLEVRAAVRELLMRVAPLLILPAGR